MSQDTILETEVKDDGKSCNCIFCHVEKTGPEVLKKVIKDPETYQAILRKMGIDEAKHFDAVHFSFARDVTEGCVRPIIRPNDEKLHLFVNVDSERIFEKNAHRGKRRLSKRLRQTKNFDPKSLDMTEELNTTANLIDIAIYSALVHELQHVKQIKDGRLVSPKKNDESKITLWDGAPIEMKYEAPTEDSRPEAVEFYQNLPWEAEAREVADRVVKELQAEGRLPDTPALPDDDECDILEQFIEHLSGANLGEIAKGIMGGDNPPDLSQDDIVLKGAIVGPNGKLIEIPDEISKTVLAMMKAAAKTKEPATVH